MMKKQYTSFIFSVVTLDPADLLTTSGDIDFFGENVIELDELPF